MKRLHVAILLFSLAVGSLLVGGVRAQGQNVQMTDYTFGNKVASCPDDWSSWTSDDGTDALVSLFTKAAGQDLPSAVRDVVTKMAGTAHVVCIVPQLNNNFFEYAAFTEGKLGSTPFKQQVTKAKASLISVS